MTGEGTSEPIGSWRLPVVRLGGVPVVLPPGAFLQASGIADAALGGIIADWAHGARLAVDLFAGVGTLSLAWHTLSRGCAPSRATRLRSWRCAARLPRRGSRV